MVIHYRDIAKVEADEGDKFENRLGVSKKCSYIIRFPYMLNITLKE